MKLSFLLAVLVAAPSLAANHGFSHKAHRHKHTTSTTPSAHDAVKMMNDIPGINALFDEAAKLGQTKLDVEQGVKNILGDPKLATMMKDLHKKHKNGASIDDMVDTALDAMLQKRDP